MRKPLVFVWRMRFIIIMIFFFLFCLSCYAAAGDPVRPRVVRARSLFAGHESRSSSSSSHARPVFTRDTRTAVAVVPADRTLSGKYRVTVVTGAANEPGKENLQRSRSSRVRRAVPYGVPTGFFLSTFQTFFFPFWSIFFFCQRFSYPPPQDLVGGGKTFEATPKFPENYTIFI